MKAIIAAAAVAGGMFVSGSDACARSILHDRVALNIGINCQWQSRCMALQREAMKHSQGYLARARPPRWKVELCNRNAGRGGYRVDWVGFDHCIHNPALPYPRRARR